METIRQIQPSFGLVIATSMLTGVLGYFAGMGSSLASYSSSAKRTAAEADSDISDADGGDDGDEEDIPADPAAAEEMLKAHANEECKLVLVVRTDLGMTKGKIAAQCGHATLACYKSALRSSPAMIKKWERWGQAKVAVKAEGEDMLDELQARALSLGLTACTVRDAGRTQIAAGSLTVLGVGPGPKSVVDQVTGDLRLL